MTPGRLRSNIVYNIAGQGIPLLLAVVTIPFVTRGLGPERFGVLALAWTFIGYFTLFDLGFGRSLTQRVAELLGEGREYDVPAIAWTGTLATFFLGIFGTGAILLLADPLVRSVLRIPPELTSESLRALQVLGLSLPIVLSTNAFRAILEAYQRFGLVTLVRAPVGAFMFLGPLMVLPFTTRLDIIVGVIVAVRMLAWVLHGWLCVYVNPALARPKLPRRQGAESLLRMGGWLTVSNIISPVLQYADRFLIGAVVSMSALAYYTTPSEIVVRVLAGPVAIAGVFFPAFATTFKGDPVRTSELFSTSVRTVLLILFPMVVLMFVWAETGLRLWVGPEFAAEGTAVARWLLVGVLFNGLAQVPLALVHGTSRAEITARIHAWEVPFYLLVLWFLLNRFGLPGAAMAWSLRVTVDAALLFLASTRIVPETRGPVWETTVWSIVALSLIGAAWWFVAREELILGLLVPLALGALLGWKGLMRPSWRRAARARVGLTEKRGAHQGPDGG